MSDLTGKVALVTGGAHGVGRAIAAELAARGAHVVVNYFHSHAEATRTEAELGATGSVEIVRASVARPEQVERMFAGIARRHGRLDILVNGAASGALVPDDEVTDDQLDAGWNTNVKGALRCSRAAAALMPDGGAIVNVSALGGSQFVMAGYLACAPAKAAVETLTRYLAAQYAANGIRVNTASAAMLVSDVADAFPDAARMQAAIRAATPLGRLGTPQEFAALVAFLAGDDARWITGQVLLADGGLSLGVPLLSAGGEAPELSEVDDPDEDRVAIVGMGMAVAGANSPEEFWDLRLAGAELFVPVPADRWSQDSFHSEDESAEDKSYQDRCVFITGFRPEAGAELPAGGEFTTSWLRHSVVQAMRGVATAPSDRFRCVIGYTPDGNQHLEEAGVVAATLDKAGKILDELDPADGAALRDDVERALHDRYRLRPGEDTSRFLPHRVGRLAIEGVLPPDTAVQMVDTACSSSLYAVDIGAKALLGGAADVAVCGGAFALGPRGTVLFSKLHGLSKRGEVRSLDRDADGVVFADGAAVVVLKRLGKARADGDEVLGVLTSTGTSSDGRGKAIYAPNPAGQARAIARARADDPARPVDWIIAHATGTPAGDMAELNTVHEHYGASAIPVTSNKSLIGHTGWAAGVVSLIEAALGLRHDTVPPQFRFTAPPADFPAERSRLRIPTTAQPLPPREDRPRTVAVTGFGFGGTNAHLLVSDPGTAKTPAAPANGRRGRIAIVAWAAHLPGLSDRDAVAAWVRGHGSGPAGTFGEKYPAPPFERVRLPPATVRTVDRCQLMILDCGHQLRERLGEAWTTYADRAGVFVGNLGPTRAGMLYANRCYLDDVDAALTAAPALAESPLLPKLRHGLRERTRNLIPPSNEDSFSGIMPNIISARVANYFDLHGPNLTLDAGLASTLSAFDTACQYLRAGDIDLAFAGGINGNDLPELRPMLTGLLDGEPPADGAFLFALTTEDIATAENMPVLAWIDDAGSTDAVAECGAGDPATARYLGAAGGLAVLRELLTRSGRSAVECHAEPDTPVARLDLDIPRSTVDVLDARFTDAGSYAPGHRCQVRRHVPELVPAPAPPSTAGRPFLPPGVVVLTDRAETVDALGPLPADALVLCCAPEPTARPGWHHVPAPSPDEVRAALGTRQPGDVRVMVDLAASAPADTCLVEDMPSVEALHDLLFLTLQHSDAASVIAVLLGGLADGITHPCTGLFTGLVKAAHLESPGTDRFAVVSDTRDAVAGMLVAERESRIPRTLPVVYEVAGCRHVRALVERPVALAEPVPSRLTAESVVVAVGGARGITAELLKALATEFRPKVYVLGSNPLGSYPDSVFEGSDDQFAAGRKEWLREQLRQRPGTTIAALDREHRRMVDARAARANLAAMTAACGAGRVRYLACDVTDPVAVEHAVREIGEPRIDLLVNAAGRNNSALLARKDFGEFRGVRDLKLRSHRNLKRALAGIPVGTWCSFGSLLGFFGQVGEADYAAGNDFLATAAEFAARAQGADEVTIGWTLWGGTGMGSGGLVSSYYERQDTYSAMAVAEGIHHFVRELHAPERVPHLVHLGDAEHRTVGDFYPGYLSTSDTSEFYLRRTVSRERDTAVFECPMDPETDAFLDGHTVRGHATLPGLFVTEIAAEAALSLRPGLEVIGFTDLTFERFIQVRGDLPSPPKRIRATVLEATDDLVSVEVRITSDIVVNGVVATRDKPHFTCRVLLAPEFTAPGWDEWAPDPDERAAPDPYHLPGSPVRLTGPFACTEGTRTHPRGARARFAPPVTPADPVWSRFRMPALLLDGMVRMGVLHPGHDGPGLMPVAVPTAIRRIELYRRANDLALADGDVELYATPGAFGTDGPAGNRFVATDLDGRILAQVKDVTATVLGRIDTTTGTFHPKGADQ